MKGLKPMVAASFSARAMRKKDRPGQAKARLLFPSDVVVFGRVTSQLSMQMAQKEIVSKAFRIK